MYNEHTSWNRQQAALCRANSLESFGRPFLSSHKSLWGNSVPTLAARKVDHIRLYNPDNQVKTLGSESIKTKFTHTLRSLEFLPNLSRLPTDILRCGPQLSCTRGGLSSPLEERERRGEGEGGGGI